MVEVIVRDEEHIGMGLFQRAHNILQAKANKALDAAERPDEMLDLSYEQMLDQITQVKRGLVSITASRKQLELQEQQLQHTVDHLQDQAKAALAQGKEDLAREALSRKAAAQSQIDFINKQTDPYFAWVYTIGRSRLQPNFQSDRVSLTMIERISTAIDDLDSLRAVGF